MLLSSAATPLYSQGWTVQSQNPYQIVLTKSKAKKINHIIHLIVTLFTGLWLFVWLYLVFTNQNAGTETKVITIDEFGNISIN
jgi:hypothetical protein